MREAEARLKTFESISRLNNGTQIEMNEIVTLVLFGFYKIENNGRLVVRCSFCKKAFTYLLYESDAAARLNKLKIIHAIASHTCAMSLNHVGDDRPFEESRLRHLLSGISLLPHTTVNFGGANLSVTAHTDLNEGLEKFIDSANSRGTVANIELDQNAFYEYSASTKCECFVEFDVTPSQEGVEWTLPSVYERHPLLIDALTGMVIV